MKSTPTGKVLLLIQSAVSLHSFIQSSISQKLGVTSKVTTLAMDSMFSFVVLISMAPLAGASMLKTLLLINKLTCLLGNAMWLVVLCWLSDVCPLSVRACDSICGNRLCVRSPVRLWRACFARYLTVTVKIRTLESIFQVLLAGSLVWWDSS